MLKIQSKDSVTALPGRTHISIFTASLKAFFMSLIVAACTTVAVADTCPPLTDGIAPQTFEKLWAGIDPRAEPLEVEVLKEWERDGIVLKIIRYRIGTFKGERAMMAGVYAYPKGGSNLPGLVHMHGGGQYANHNIAFLAAKRGYPTISIAWAGRIRAPDYTVNVPGVKLFWEGKTNDPNYKVTTDWGAIDGYHSPSRFKKSNFATNPPSEHTLDPLSSARNSGWFLVTIGARRALTFLEQQPEVDGDRLGVYGFSMGGKLSVMVAGTDDRVKVVAPAVGGISDRYKAWPNYKGLLSDDVYVSRIRCPIAFLTPANDFHGRINDLPASVEALRTDQWRISNAPHLGHNNPLPYDAVAHLWFDQHLKGTFAMPATPKTELNLKKPSGVPSLVVVPDTSKPIKSVEVYYTQQGQLPDNLSNIKNTTSRFWRYASVVRSGGKWTAELPLFSPDKPLWVYANVTYPLEKPVNRAKEFTLSSLVHLVTSNELKAAGVKSALAPSLVIEKFEKGWEKEWYHLSHLGMASTYKLYDDQYMAPPGASMALDVRSAEPNTLVIRLDDAGAEVSLVGGEVWQEVVLQPADFNYSDGRVRSDWLDIRELKLSHTDTLRSKGSNKVLKLGRNWKGKGPEIRNLRWEGGSFVERSKPYVEEAYSQPGESK